MHELMHELTDSDLKRIANLCLNHAMELHETNTPYAIDYLRFGKAIFAERARRFGA